MSLLLQHTQERIAAFLAEIRRLLESEFPHDHSKGALNELHQVFSAEEDLLTSFSPQSTADIVKQQCSLTLLKLYNYSPLLGFILRSTNVRNAFEVIGPFLRITRKVLESGSPYGSSSTRLLLSSEWDYSPFTYPAIPDLPGYLFIGLPAPESGNPLLVPLAGHELGHSVWIRKSLEDQYRPTAKAEIVRQIETRWTEYSSLFRPKPALKPSDLTTDMFALESWSLALNVCLKQVEESLCDCLGLRLFGTSYLHAFAYLVSPGLLRRSVSYPAMQTRVKNLLTAAGKYGVKTPAGYTDLFNADRTIDLVSSDEFQLSIADGALASIIPTIINHADDIAREAALPKPTQAEEDRILKRFKNGVPAERSVTIVDIVNAAWRAMIDPQLLEDLPIEAERRSAVLKELVLKNFEVFEIEQIQAT